MASVLWTFSVALVLAVPAGALAQGRNLLYSVDPTIGGVGVLLQPTRPTLHLPNQMLRITPDRSDLLDDQVTDYPLLMTSHRQAMVFGFLPFSDDGQPVWGRRLVYDNEVTRPYLYTADLEGSSIEIAPSRKSAIIRVHFDGDSGRLRFTTLGKEGDYELQGNNVITGTAGFDGMKAYLYAITDRPVSGCRYETDGSRANMALSVAGKDVCIRYAVSYISTDQARINLEREIPSFDFDKVCDTARSVWEKTMGKVSVEGGTPRHLATFATALYRCFERMVDINEYGRYYSGFDHRVHKSKAPFYVDNWMWDTHIALEPLQTILNPDMEVQKINSYLDMYRQCGTLPSFAVIWGDWPAMTGNYAAVWMTDAWAKGLRFDLKTAYEAGKKNSLTQTMLPWRNGPQCVLDSFYAEHGYYPGLHPGEKETVALVEDNWEKRQCVGLTTATSYCDWALAQQARILGKKDDVGLFLRRAAFYKNLYRPDKGMFWPKDDKGEWIEGVDPRYMDRAYFTENNAYTFQWDVKHDLNGLFDLMGGRKEAEKKLDNLFRIPLGMSKWSFWQILPDATGMIGQYACGNEPGFHIPYIYDYLGTPWKTQKHIHLVMDSYFNDSYYGLPGDEDGGGMSAFVVFSMMGFFPVTPGVPVYAIGSPFFETCTLHLDNGKDFTVKAVNFSEGNKYIRKAVLNGKVLNRCWFSHEELMGGGTLELTMDSRPNKQWASGPQAAPPSDINYINK